MKYFVRAVKGCWCGVCVSREDLEMVVRKKIKQIENPCGFLLWLTEAKSASGEGKQLRLSGGWQLVGFRGLRGRRWLTELMWSKCSTGEK